MSLLATQLSIPDDIAQEVEACTKEGWILQTLKGKHKNICSLIAQGVGRKETAAITGVTPEYVSMLMKQPLCLEYIRGITQAADAQLEAQYSASVEAIGETLREGSHEDKIKAARLQMEATGRIGQRTQTTASQPMNDRLVALAERLTSLLQTKHNIIDGEFRETGS